MPQAKFILTISLTMLCTWWPGDARGQCLLANPSFEVSGSGGDVFGGWNQFESVGYSTNATHGALSARVTAPNIGDWGTSGYWQQFDSAPGDRWVASVEAWHTSVKPLTGQSRAMLNIEWRNGAGELISFESHAPVNSSTPFDQIQQFTVTSQPAPSGTVAARILLGVLQGPGEPSADVYYDQATFYSAGPPTQDDLQWNDFPGGRTIDFGGRSWRVKGPGYYGPGPNSFCDDASCTWVDVDGRLHMTIQRIGGTWYSTEIALEEALGYGDYIFTTIGRLDALHENVVLGMFLWEYGRCWDTEYLWWNPYNEIDIEFSRWSDPSHPTVGQFVAQPFDWPGNISPFSASFSDGELTSHAFRWLPDRVEFRSWRGGPQDEAPENMIHQWSYSGRHIPRPEQPRVHINLWQVNDPPNTNQEVIVDQFNFVPEGTASAVPSTASPPSHLAAAKPNPFNPHTTIEYRMQKGGHAEIVVYDVSGRLVRTLVRGFVSAGVHETVWNGRDDSGNRVASGVYLYQFRTGRIVETRKAVLLK